MLWNFFDPINMFSAFYIPDDYIRDMMLAFVPEAEFMEFEDAITLAKERDEEAANVLLESLMEGDAL